jgi:hypothetical protein
MIMSNSTCNGWTNYATWRVNLEMFDGFDPREYGFDLSSHYELANELKDYAESAIEDSSSDGLARDYALAFLSSVNWDEIAKHMTKYFANEDEDCVSE